MARFAFQKGLTSRAFCKGAGRLLTKGGAFVKRHLHEVQGVASIVAPEFAPQIAAAAGAANKAASMAVRAGSAMEANAGSGVKGVVHSLKGGVEAALM